MTPNLSAETLDEADAELLQVHLRHWRASLLGALAVTLVVAWGFVSYLPDHRMWIWAALGLLNCGWLASWCMQQEGLQRSSMTSTRPGSSLTLSVVTNGLLWGSIGWWLPAGQEPMQLVAATIGSAAITGAASANDSAHRLRLTVGSAIAAMTSCLLCHARMPFAALAFLLLGLVILRYGLLLHRSVLDSIRQRLVVTAMSRELVAEQAARREAEREQTVLAERQRLLRDMHDRIAASLISAVKMMEQQQLGVGEAVGIVRECIDDLRLVIDSLEPLGNDLVTLLATLRYRLGHRVERAGIRIDWQMADIPPLSWLGPPEALELSRIFQEAIANVLKHAHAKSILIMTAMDEQDSTRVRMCIEDDGIGFMAGTPREGRGLKHMHERALRLHGHIEMVTRPGSGTRITLDLPLRLRDL